MPKLTYSLLMVNTPTGPGVSPGPLSCKRLLAKP